MKTISAFLSALQPSKTIDLATGDYLFQQNDVSKGIYVVNKGRVKLIRHSIDGHQAVVHIAQAQNSLAEASLFAEHYHCYAQAAIPSQVYLYDKEYVLDYLSKNTHLALNFIEILAKQIQTLRLLLELRGIRSPRERFIQYLKLMVDSEHRVKIESTYKDLATTLGMTHETLYRLLGQLEKGKLIRRDQQTIVLSI